MITNYFPKSFDIKTASKWLVFVIDLIIICVSFVLSYLIRFNLTFNFDVEKLMVQIPIVLIVSAFSFFAIGSYKSVVRHTGVRDVYNIFNAICLSSILLIVFVLINRQLDVFDNFTIPLSIIIIHSLIGFVSLTALRYAFKALHQNLINNIKAYKNVLIFGAGELGVITYNTITAHSKNPAKVIGFVDYDRKKIGKQINGLDVYETNVFTHDFFVSKNISEVIFSLQDVDASKLRSMVEELVDFPVTVKIVPPVEDWINGELKVSQIKNIQIEDLLNRAPISIANSKIDGELKDKIVMVTGGAGSIGSEIVRQICKYDYKSLIIIDQAESALYDLQQELKQSKYYNFVPIVADVRDKNRMNKIFQDFAPNLIFHAAAYKHVPLMEYNPYEAININVRGSKNIADLAIVHGADKFVLISTDKAVNPTNVMGATKRIAEMYISCLQQQQQKTKFITTRFGNVLGSNGSVIPLFKKQIENGGPLTVTHQEITRYFMTIPEASQLVLEAGAMGAGGEIFIFDMGESVKIFDLAKNMIKLSGLRYPEDIDVKITGLRPGEKLYEELLANGENTLPTYHNKIMISKVRDLKYSWTKNKIEELCVSNKIFGDNPVRLMKEIVPEYISNNSEMSKFDDTTKKMGTSDKKTSEILQS